ncbi:hypothetical protein GALL_452070 [mine drainage metagenome]|uniref:Uncharacterized protein n=1 Tax=mine drainage metagenome TaxID=410659 RepID=A0A1J5QB05_9ZZZZ
MASILFIIGGSLFGILGLIHAAYTFADLSHPRRLVPDNPAVMAAMSASGVRLARGGTTMWRAWLGFNFSHSLGAVVFGIACIAVGLTLPSLTLPKAALLLPVVVGLIYLWLAIRYWFRIPVIGIAVGTLFLAAGWLTY